MPELHNLAFEVKDQGWMYCVFKFGDVFDSIEDVKKAVVSHFS
jgi:hypothetical protein